MPSSSSCEPVWSIDLANRVGRLANLAAAQADRGLRAANLAVGPNTQEGRPGMGSQAGFKPIKWVRDSAPWCKTMWAAMAAPAEWPAITVGVMSICSSKALSPSAMPCSDRLSPLPLLVKA